MKTTEVSFTHVNAYYNLKDNQVKPGRLQDRLVIVENDSQFYDPRFNVSLRKVDYSDLFNSIANSSESFGEFESTNSCEVELKSNQPEDKKSLVNINSVANLNKQKVTSLVKAGTLVDTISKQAQTLSSIQTYYDQILTSFLTKPGNKIKFEPVTLMEKTKQIFASKNGQSPAIVDDKLVTIGKFLGKGSYGKVHQFDESLSINEPKEIFKHARKHKSNPNPRMAKTAKNDIENEFKMLKFLNRNGEVLGIQAAPRKFVNLTVLERQPDDSVKTKQRFGYIGIKYDGDYENKDNQGQSINEKLLDFYQLLSGLQFLANENILHGDIKTENIFIKKDENGFKSVVISDLGGARADDQVLIDLKQKDTTHTSNYASFKELRQVVKTAKNDQKETCIKLEKQRDVLAMGVVLYKALTSEQNSPYPLDPYGYLLTNKPYIEIQDPNVPTELKELVLKMLHPNPEKRLTAQEAFNELNELNNDKYPTVYESIQNKMSEK